MKLITRFKNKKYSILLKSGEMALTPPKCSHALLGVTYCKCLVFTKGPRSGKNFEVDTIRLKKNLYD